MKPLNPRRRYFGRTCKSHSNMLPALTSAEAEALRAGRAIERHEDASGSLEAFFHAQLLRVSRRLKRAEHKIIKARKAEVENARMVEAILTIRR